MMQTKVSIFSSFAADLDNPALGLRFSAVCIHITRHKQELINIGSQISNPKCIHRWSSHNIKWTSAKKVLRKKYFYFYLLDYIRTRIYSNLNFKLNMLVFCVT